MEGRMIRFCQRIRGAAHVVRWCFHPHLKDESVAEHSFFVAIFAMVLAVKAELPTQIRDLVIGTALMHDAEEAITGDLPALAKRGCPGWPEDVEKKGESELLEDANQLRIYRTSMPIIKLADRLASLMYADQETKMGNSLFVKIRSELIQELYAMIDRLPERYEEEDGLSKEAKVALWRSAIDLMEGLGFSKEEGTPQVQTISHL